MNDKLLASLSLCRKAGKLVMGFEPVKEACQNGSAKLLLLTEDLSPKSRKEIVRVAEQQGVRYADIHYTMDAIKLLVGRRSGILAITDDGFVTVLAKHLPV